MEYGAFMRATVPYEALAQQRYPGTYHSQHAGYPSYAMDARNFMHMAHLHQQRQQHAASLMGAEDPNRGPPRQNEPKPRLAKEEVDLLEREFAKNPKPNSSTKRDLAERMGVEVPRINNWFQNRRAKAKLQMKERQNRDRAAAGDSDSTDDHEASSTEAPCSEESRHASVNLSSAPFPSDASGDTKVKPDSGASEREQDKAAQSALVRSSSRPEEMDSQMFAEMTYPSPESVLSNPSNAEHTMSMLNAALPSSQPLVNSCMAMSPYVGVECSAAPAVELSNSAPTVEHLGGLDGEADFLESIEHSMPCEFELQEAASFPSEYLPRAVVDDSMLVHTAADSAHRLQQHSSAVLVLEEMVKAEEPHLSPASLSQSPPPPASSADLLRFQSPPPPSNLAIRRNIRRPAPLWLSSSSTSPVIGYGPKTCIEPSRPSPMRRVASATGTLSGRIQKPMSASAPRSPFSRELFLQSLQRAQSPVMESISGTLSPRLSEQPTRENTVSSCTSDEDQMYTLNSTHMPIREHSITSPPVTPGFHPSQFEAVFPYGVSGPLGFPHDDSCLTPGLISNGSDFELSMAAPGSYACVSQPPTPSFPGHSMGPNFWGPLGGTVAPNGVEYSFPESYPDLAPGRTSPGPAKAKQFQFTQNVTPQDFHIPK